MWLSRHRADRQRLGHLLAAHRSRATQTARVYYAHVDFSGAITVAPKLVASIAKIPFRSHYYMVTWNAGHFGLFTAEGATLYYQSLSLDGTVSQRHPVGPPLFVDPQFRTRRPTATCIRSPADSWASSRASVSVTPAATPSRSTRTAPRSAAS
jgi:hypothetical protein